MSYERLQQPVLKLPRRRRSKVPLLLRRVQCALASPPVYHSYLFRDALRMYDCARPFQLRRLRCGMVLSTPVFERQFLHAHVLLANFKG